AFVYAADHDRTYSDGRIRDAYMAGDIALPPGWTPNGRLGTVPVSGFYRNESFTEVEQGGVSVGNDACVMIALLRLYDSTRDVRYLHAAMRLGDLSRGSRNDTGTYKGFQGGLDNPESQSPARREWASAEHNIDVYAAFMHLFWISGESKWRTDALHARNFV